MNSNTIYLENTKFMPWGTNFSGDPRKDKYGSSQRQGNVIIPDIMMARQLIDEGFNVKMSKPREGADENESPSYFTKVILSYRYKTGEPVRVPPKVFFIEDGFETELVEDTVGRRVDEARVDHVNMVLNKYEGPNGKSLYIRSMEVFQKTDDDPITMRHKRHAEHEMEITSFNPECDED